MISNRQLEARFFAGLAALTLVVGAGCSSNRERESAEPAQAAPAAAAAESAPPEMTATEAAVANAAASASSESAPAPAETGPVLNPSAPKSYTVKRGDTLWGIATMFLRDPWLWPEVWYINPQVENPHLIYPGDVLALAYGADGRPQIRLERGGAARLDPRLHSSPLDGAIPAVPYSAIAAFLSRPSVLTKDQVKQAPHVLAFRDGHTVAGAGHDIYVRDLNAEQNARFSVMHVGDPIRDPDGHGIVGYQGIYTATAVVTAPGNPAKAQLTDSTRETLVGDRLFAADSNVPIDFKQRPPSTDIHGRIVSVVDGVELIGQYQVVVINRGARDGLEVGHILAVDQAGEVVRDRHSGWMGTRVRLPNERAGTLLVFKTFDRVSYGLIVGASTTMRVADIVRTP